jgi:hypothetical protein
MKNAPWPPIRTTSLLINSVLFAPQSARTPRGRPSSLSHARLRAHHLALPNEGVLKRTLNYVTALRRELSERNVQYAQCNGLDHTLIEMQASYMARGAVLQKAS